MQIDIDSNFTASSLKELNEQLTEVFQKLFASLQKVPDFHLDFDPATPLPADLRAGTVVFQQTSKNTLKVGVWDGNNLNITT